jgi:transketolase
MMESIRDAFGRALVEAGREYSDVVAVSCDLKEATRLQPFFDAFPERSFEVGIAEANGIGISAGLALSGFRPFISSFAAFIAGRNVEIRTSIAYNRAPVVVVGTHGGLIGPDGTTQAGLQDIAVMRSIPGFTVLQPATPIETRAIVGHVARARDMVYLRIARNSVPELFDERYRFEPGRGIIVRDGGQVTIISSGPPLHAALACAEALAGSIDVMVVNMPSLKPIDEEMILHCARRTRAIVTVEDHSILGGLGSGVAEVVAGAGVGVPVVRHGIADVFIESAKPAELEHVYKLDAEGVALVVRRTWAWLMADAKSKGSPDRQEYSPLHFDRRATR